MDSGVAVLVFDEAPPTSNENNGVGGRGHPNAVARTKRRWEEIWGVELMRARMPRGCSHVHAKFLVEYQTRGTRDSDNLLFPLSKPLGDILKQMGVIADDGPQFYSWDRPEVMLGVQGLNARTRSRTTIHLEYKRPPA